MSSTNRGKAREAHVSDYYVTPADTIRDFLSAFNEDGFKGDKYPLTILDPCAGGDVENNWMAYPAALKRHSGWKIGKLTTVDIRQDSLAEFKHDYLNLPAPKEKYDLVITNPPFNQALPIIKKALDEVRDNGLVIMLLRLNFFGSMERQSFWQSTMPIFSYVHTRRPKFMNTKGTDSIEYQHCVWQKGNYPRFTKLRII